MGEGVRVFLHGRFVALLFGLLANTLESAVVDALKMPVCVRFVAVVQACIGAEGVTANTRVHGGHALLPTKPHCLLACPLGEVCSGRGAATPFVFV
jgi:hypothetical protein